MLYHFCHLNILPPTAVAWQAMTHRTHSLIFAQPRCFERTLVNDNCDEKYGVLQLPFAKTLGVTGVSIKAAQHVLSCKGDGTVLDLCIA